MSEKLVTDFKAARRVSVPIVALSTPDMGATLDLLAATAEKETPMPPVFVWDCIHGLKAFAGQKIHAEALRQWDIKPEASCDPLAVLSSAEAKMPPKSVLFMMNAHLVIREAGLAGIQAIWNLRDTLKGNKRTLVLMGAMMPIPKELEGDVVVLDEELPNAEKLHTIVVKQHENAGLPEPKADAVTRAIDALAGLPAFAAEQVTAMSLTRDGLALDALWARKRTAIEQTPGLSVWQGGETFDTIGGYDNVKTFASRLIKGPNRPAGIVFMDEIEKMMAGARGDNTGVSQGQHQALLAFMQDTKARGLLFVGHPGSGKSAIGKAIGNSAGVPTIQLDLNGMKAGIVGQSEEMTRNALKVVQAVCQSRALFVATCNSLEGLSPELRRRFRNGTFFFDLPDAVERESIWQIYGKKYKIDVSKKNRPDDDDWTGSEIENCCDQAFSIEAGLKEAASYIVPQAVAMSAAVKRRREEASGSIVSASYPGRYMGPGVRDMIADADSGKSKGTRRIELDK